MRRRVVGRAFVIIPFLLYAGYCFAAEAGEFPSARAPVYQIVPLEDPDTALHADAEALGLDLSGTVLEEDHMGWWIRSNDQFEIRRSIGAGYFTYIYKHTDWSSFEDPKRPINEDNLRRDALSRLEALGIPGDQVLRASVRRLVTETLDEKGTTVSRQTFGYLVYVMRQIDGIPVVGSTAEVAYDARGNLHKINTSWRQVKGQPVAWKSVIGGNVLGANALALLEGFQSAKPSLPPAVYHTVYAFRESAYSDPQDVFELQYVITYRFDTSPIFREALPATE